MFGGRGNATAPELPGKNPLAPDPRGKTFAPVEAVAGHRSRHGEIGPLESDLTGGLCSYALCTPIQEILQPNSLKNINLLIYAFMTANHTNPLDAQGTLCSRYCL